VALADPELELLQEILAEDPADAVFLQVAREYVRRGAWGEALRVLTAAADAGSAEPEGHSLLAVAAFEAEQYLRALTALQRFGEDVEHSDLLSRIRVIALERSGQVARARAAAVAHLARYPDDADVVAVRDRAARRTPTPGGVARAEDPLVNAARAEAYVAVGRVDRAVRVYRRLLYRNPGHREYERRLRELEGERPELADDLSEELTADMEAQHAPGPPGLVMPAPVAATPAPALGRVGPGGAAAAAGHRPVAPTAVPLVARGEAEERGYTSFERESTDVAARASVEHVARVIERQRRATGTSMPRSAVPEEELEEPQLTPSAQMLKAAEEVDVDELRDRIRQARERRVRRRSLIRK
jgi:tetratricopeptide (TPR) repeat protein